MKSSLPLMCSGDPKLDLKRSSCDGARIALCGDSSWLRVSTSASPPSTAHELGPRSHDCPAATTASTASLHDIRSNDRGRREDSRLPHIANSDGSGDNSPCCRRRTHAVTEDHE
jgi:hypothetical protein